ncbi:MAG: glycerate kinase, partial [Gammaproteobacteria bacterium]|nr:glycerate kinase [Gammaproteobacteria bacterium]
AQVHAERALRHLGRGQRIALISGGETGVRVSHPDGRGGRNSCYLLGLALALRGEAGIWALAADTDGIDGTEHNAGAVLAPDSLARAAKLGLDGER